MSKYIIAIHTYGSHRVKSRLTGKTVSAYKMGYTSAASAVLLAMYGDKARDVSSKHASYHYIQIDADVTVRHGLYCSKSRILSWHKPKPSQGRCIVRQCIAGRMRHGSSSRIC